MAKVTIYTRTLEEILTATVNFPEDTHYVTEYLPMYLATLRENLEAEGHELEERVDCDPGPSEKVEGDDEESARLVLDRVGTFWEWFN